MTVRQLLEGMDSRELSEWMAYDRIDPFGQWRDDLRMGIATSVYLNTKLRKGAKAIVPTDLIPKFEKTKPISVGRRIKTAMKAMMKKGAH